MSKKPTAFDPDYAVPPGATLLETISALGMNQTELALRMGRPVKTISEIINGKAEITAETAIQLERVTAVPAVFWNNAEANYRERKARIKARNQLAAQTAWLKTFSYSEMTRLRLLSPVSGEVEQVGQLLSFFAVASADQWQETYSRLEGAAREAKGQKSALTDLSVWLRTGEILAQRQQTEPYDSSKFEAALNQIRKLTSEDAAQAWQKVCKLCAAAGVAVVLVPELPKTHVFGFTRWLTPTKALVQLSLRYKTDDVLWFTFFHEAAHILLHGKKEVFMEVRGAESPKETEADDWASEHLISSKDWQSYLTSLTRPVSESAILAFARQQQIAPSIVVGRLQHREKIVQPNHFNQLKQRIEINWAGLV